MFKLTATEENKLNLIRWVEKHFDHYCLLDSNNYQEKYSTINWEIAFGAKRVLSRSFENAFEHLKNFCNESQSRIYGLLSYDLKNDVEKLDSKNKSLINFPDIAFFEPEFIVKEIDGFLISENFDLVNNIKEVEEFIIPEHPKKSFKELQSRDEYLDCIKQLKKHIYDGDIYEINYCISFIITEYNCDIVSIFNQLKKFSPNPFTCLLKFNNQYIISASPERFLKKVAKKIISQPIKGTIKRTGNIEKDKEELLNSEKERAENVMIVDLVRNDLKKCSEIGSIKVEELFGIYTFPQLHQMISTIVGTARRNMHVVDIIKSCFPMGSMTGAPKVRAMQLIDQYENVKRSAFSGAVGYIDNEKNEFDFNVIIRSLFYDSDINVLSYNVGSAITYDSIPGLEYEECMLKAEAIKKVLGIK